MEGSRNHDFDLLEKSQMHRLIVSGSGGVTQYGMYETYSAADEQLQYISFLLYFPHP